MHNFYDELNRICSTQVRSPRFPNTVLNTIVYEYNSSGQIKRAAEYYNDPNDTRGAKLFVDLSYSYNYLGRVTEIEFDYPENSSIPSEGVSYVWKMMFTYNKRGQLKTSGSIQVSASEGLVYTQYTYYYDESGRVSARTAESWFAEEKPRESDSTNLIPWIYVDSTNSRYRMLSNSSVVRVTRECFNDLGYLVSSFDSAISQSTASASYGVTQKDMEYRTFNQSGASLAVHHPFQNIGYSPLAKHYGRHLPYFPGATKAKIRFYNSSEMSDPFSSQSQILFYGNNRDPSYESKATTFSVYPNPAKEWIRLRWSQNGGYGSGILRLCNMQGQPMLEEWVDGPDAQVDLRELRAGLYFYDLELEGKHHKGKLIKR